MQLRVHLLSKAVVNFENAIHPDKSANPYGTLNSLNFPCRIYLAPQSKHEPQWVTFLNQGLETRLAGLYQAHVSALVLLEADSRIFAVTFGHGASLLQRQYIVPDFGLRVVINLVNPSELRSLDHKTYDDLVLATRQQSSKDTDLTSFGLNAATDLLRAVTGVPDDPFFGSRLAGADSVCLSPDISFPDLPSLCIKLLAAYTDTRYKKHFAWVDNITEVRDTTLRAILNAQLIATLKSGGDTFMHLAPATIEDWKDVELYDFGGVGRHRYHFPDLSLASYLGILSRGVTHLDIESLSRHVVRVKYATGSEFIDKWTVYDCIVWETQHAGQQYALFDGRWMMIDTAFAADVRNAVLAIVANVATLPDAVIGASEGDYNRCASAGNADLALMDKKTIRTHGAPSPIEFCDLFGINRHLIHVKKRSSSATLSHLFAQGTVSSELLLSDNTFRDRVRDILSTQGYTNHAMLVPCSRPDPQAFTVIYAVICPKGFSCNPPVPFFSQVNLRQAQQRLQAFGYNVALQTIATR